MFGTLLIAVSFFLFAFILQNYADYAPLVHADTHIQNLIYTIRSDAFNSFAFFFTLLGTWQIVFSGLMVIGFMLFSLNLLPYLYALVISVTGGELIVAIVKHAAQRPRPSALYALLAANGFSFPSGHSLLAISFYGFIAYIIYRLSKTKTAKILAVAGGLTMIGLISFSRIYLGVHWSSDILASIALGTTWVTLLIIILEIQHEQPIDAHIVHFIEKKFVFIPSCILGAFWLSYIGYFFIAHHLDFATDTNIQYERKK